MWVRERECVCACMHVSVDVRESVCVCASIRSVCARA